MRDYSEKRDFIRMQVETDIELFVRDGPSPVLKGHCEDLSATGMSVRLSQPLDLGTELETRMASHNPDFPPFETRARVVRCDHLEEGAVSLGLEILEVTR
ncbi:MAG: PilZ domain-containing protein [Oleiphilaceae bacterium]|nr:PilZ domain-containing protein [Oleiphilaceae bacterium]